MSKKELSVLIIEDSPESLTILQNMLDSYKCKVYCGSNSKNFNDAISNTKFDVVFMDHILYNDDDGSELIRKYKKEYPNSSTQFVCITGAIYTPRDVCMFLRMGYDDVLPKPFDQDYLKRILSKLK